MQANEINETNETNETSQPAAAMPAPAPAKRPRPLAGFVIAGAALVALFGLAALKGRVKDQPTS
ncbi:MAG TPA: hypothetical protein VF525_01965 [Pyrinomonadaceae bacterium]|jgi:hypothetical protein